MKHQAMPHSSEHEAAPGLLLGPSDDLAVGDHVEGDGQLLEDGHHVPVVLRAALQVRGAPRLLHLREEGLKVRLGWARNLKYVRFCTFSCPHFPPPQCRHHL